MLQIPREHHVKYTSYVKLRASSNHAADSKRANIKLSYYKQWECTENTVRSYLSELQISKHIGYPNGFSKATPTISGYFCRWEAGCNCSNGWYRVLQGSLYPLGSSWRHRITSTGKVGFSKKVKATVKISHWVLLADHMRPVERKPSNGLRLCTF